DPSIKELKVLMERSKIVLSYGSFTIISNIIDQKYPEYQKAFMADLPNQVIVSRKRLLESIRRVALVAPEDNNRIRFEISAENFEINTSNRDTGDAKEFVEEYQYTGAETAVSFNYRFMVSILDVIDTEKVCIKLGSPKEPLMIYNEPQPENQKITFLLMPLRS
ncbi:MAG: DNA polymerase III subunit beta, partial [Candidatus Cloacimonetes bacterium]|nr:DNA polymerase III subunit beta [Candidatus Cloacimonadota bacterium]